ncbi:MAG: hypothetical protein PVJ09_02015 [Candidatus Woesebacteria bacterium]|jgi:hypothetical protein
MKKNKDIFGFNKEKLKQWFLYWAVLALGLFLLVFLITGTWIGVEVKERCMMAQSRYEGDCVEALIQVVDGDENSFRERNYAIWTLGQLGDEKAREVLEKHYTGVIPEREPYDKGLSQYELQKSLKLLDGGFNVTHLLWNADVYSKLLLN